MYELASLIASKLARQSRNTLLVPIGYSRMKNPYTCIREQYHREETRDDVWSMVNYR